MNPQKIFLESSYENKGSFVIAANYWQGSLTKGIILLHMMPATKESWGAFSERLNEKGYHVLAIDLRGHGESTNWKDEDGKEHVFNFSSFSDKNHQDSFSDVEASRNFLISCGLSPENIFIGGASIGANLSLQYLATFPDAEKAILLSPGLNYRGIDTNELINRIQNKQKAFISAAEDDAYSYESSLVLSQKSPKNVIFHAFNIGGHGTKLFEIHPELSDILISFLES